MGREHPSLNPIEAGAALRVWRAFQQYRTGEMGRAPMLNIPEFSRKFVVYLGLKKAPDLEFALRQCMSKLDPGWGLQILTTRETDNWIRSKLLGWSFVHFNILQREGSARPDRDKLLRTEAFWDQVLGENLLFIDPDTIVCGTEINDFTNYDYIAPLWKNGLSPWCRFGNGELSFRRKQAMIEICRSCNTNEWLFPSEGVFYSIMMRVEGDRYNLPSDEIAGAFGVEQVVFAAPFALHRAWQYIAADALSGILQNAR